MGIQALVTRALAWVRRGPASARRGFSAGRAGFVAAWQTITPEHTNKVLDSLGWIAITRGLLYGVGVLPRSQVPRGLDLLSSELLYLYGILWLLVGAFSVITARMANGTRRLWAQRALGSLCVTWAICYVFGAIFPAPGIPEGAAWIAAVFYLLIGRIAWNAGTKPKTIKPSVLVFRSRRYGNEDVIIVDDRED